MINISDSEISMGASNTPQQPLLSQRAAIIFTLSILVALTFGVCAFLTSRTPGTAVMAGLGAFGAVAAGLHRILE
jgi:hypothetical protein